MILLSIFGVYLDKMFRNKICLISLLIIFLSGCGGGDAGGVAPPALEPSPTSSLSASSNLVILDTVVTLTWSSTNATSCEASGAWSDSKATSGLEEVTISTPGNNKFTITCVGAGGSRSASVIVEGYIDNRIVFEDFSYSFNDIYGEVVVSYSMSDHTTTGLPDSTEKYRIEDYGFMRVTIDGLHNGSEEGPESVDPGPFSSGGYWFGADFNSDYYKDMYFIGHTDGAVDWVPQGLLMAYINDGNGHFKLAPEIFENGEFPCIWGGGPQVDKTDPNDPCGFAQSNNFPLVADFNGDDVKDVFTISMIFLSEDGIIKNKSYSNLPDLFFLDHVGPIFSHRVDDGDVDGDGDLDIFLPIKGSTKTNYMFDGSYAGCDGCNDQVPWTMLINDGAGHFTANHNFNAPGWNYENGTLIWATGTTIGDFNGDGWGDIAVGWESPEYASNYGWLENSAGNIYLNNGSNDWRSDPINLPQNWFGPNGIGVDLDTFDFNNDGHADIVMTATRHDPYYTGNVIQFFLNDGNGNFSDVTTTYNPDYGKYELGSGSGLWNGGGLLHIVDFDRDGDLDIVSTNGRSYVLINNGNFFDLYDDFPIKQSGKGGNLWPVSIDEKNWYSFISSFGGYVDQDTSYKEYFQILSQSEE